MGNQRYPILDERHTLVGCSNSGSEKVRHGVWYVCRVVRESGGGEDEDGRKKAKTNRGQGRIDK